MDFARLMPYALAAFALAVSVGWFVLHDRAVATKAVAVDRAAANEVVIAAQQKSIADKQKIIDFADELSKVRYAQTVAANKAAAQYKDALNKIAADPDVARLLGTRLPESLRQLRRAQSAAPGGGDRVPVLHAPGVAAADTGAAIPGSDGGGIAGGKPDGAAGAGFVQRGQGQREPTGQPATRNAADSTAWYNPMTWFQPAPVRNAP